MNDAQAFVLLVAFTTAAVVAGRMIPTDLNFIQRTCQQTPEPSFCVQTLTSDKRSLNTSSVAGLTVIALDITIAAAGATLANIESTRDNNPGTSLSEAMSLCAEVYDNAIDDLREGQNDMASQDFAAAEQLVAGTEDAPTDCDKAIDDNNVGASPIRGENKRVRDLVGLSGDLLDLLNS